MVNYRIRSEKHISRRMTLVICLAAGALTASTVIPMTLREVSAQASRVAVGRIERIVSHKDADTGRLQSRIEVTETRSLQGEPLGTLTFEMAGGTLDDVRQWIAGFPQFQVGDQVVLFLAETTGTPGGPTVGLWQGVYFVEADGTVGDHRRQPLAEIRGDQAVKAPVARDGRVAQGTRVSLDEFLARVRGFRQLASGAPDRR